jgi:excisionase family DNA binding protein
MPSNAVQQHVDDARRVVADARHEEHLAVTELARHWHVSRRQVLKLIDCGQLHAHRVGRLLRIAPEEINRYESMNQAPG